MSKIVVVTSGKGGVGKTTTSAAFGTALSINGYRTVIIDFDVGLRNLDLIMGCERRVIFDFVNVINEDVHLNQALIKDKYTDKLYILPASQTRDKEALHIQGVGKVLEELSQNFDYIICDSPAGIERGAFLAMYYADEAIVVANPEVSSVRDSDRMLGLLSSKSQKSKNQKNKMKEHLILTRYSPKRVKKGDMLSIKDVQEILNISLIGVIPESTDILKASNLGKPITLNKKSYAGQAYLDAADRFLGIKKPYRFIKSENFFTRLLRRKIFR